MKGSQYSVPVQYVGKTLYFRITYGFRIEIYDKGGNLLLTREASDKKHDVRSDPADYAAIAPAVSTSIPQIRRDFTARFTNGKRYLDAAGRKFVQPTHHARKIMMLADIYDDATLDRLIGYCVEHDKMDITSFKGILRDFNSGNLELTGPEKDGLPADYRDDDPALTRDCSYYEENAMLEVSG